MDEVATADAALDPPVDWAPRVVADLRKVSAGIAAGAVVGFLVGGTTSRLAMMLLARLNPKATGRISDDGFRMGQFVLGDTLGLMLVCAFLGMASGLVFVAVRDLRFGPTWFQWLSLVGGPAVVVGSMLVHTDGIDFVILEPALLAIGLFVAVPALHSVALVALGDRWLSPDAPFATSRRLWAAPLVLLVPIFPLIGMVALGILAHQAWLQGGQDRPEVGRWIRLAARLALTAVFALSLAELVSETITLTQG